MVPCLGVGSGSDGYLCTFLSVPTVQVEGQHSQECCQCQDCIHFRSFPSSQATQALCFVGWAGSHLLLRFLPTTSLYTLRKQTSKLRCVPKFVGEQEKQTEHFQILFSSHPPCQREKAAEIQQSIRPGLRVLSPTWQQTIHNRAAALKTEQCANYGFRAVSLCSNPQAWAHCSSQSAGTMIIEPSTAPAP
jgi:hypothetical protein